MYRKLRWFVRKKFRFQKGEDFSFETEESKYEDTPKCVDDISDVPITCWAPNNI